MTAAAKTRTVLGDRSDITLVQPKRTTSQLALTAIRTDGGTQSRDGLTQERIDEYAETMAEAQGWGDFDPIEVMYDGTSYWLVDGFHRLAAAKSVPLLVSEAPAYVQQGTRRDAVLASVGVNARHGLPRTAADKRRAIEKLLRDPEWRLWADREIARRCVVSPDTVGRLRRELSLSDPSVMGGDERTYLTKHGTVATMAVGNIGKGADDALVETLLSASDRSAPFGQALADATVEQLEAALARIDAGVDKWRYFKVGSRRQLLISAQAIPSDVDLAAQEEELAGQWTEEDLAAHAKENAEFYADKQLPAQEMTLDQAIAAIWRQIKLNAHSTDAQPRLNWFKGQSATFWLKQTGAQWAVLEAALARVRTELEGNIAHSQRQSQAEAQKAKTPASQWANAFPDTPPEFLEAGIVIEEATPNYFRWVEMDESKFRAGALHDTPAQAIANARKVFGIYLPDDEEQAAIAEVDAEAAEEDAERAAREEERLLAAPAIPAMATVEQLRAQLGEWLGEQARVRDLDDKYYMLGEMIEGQYDSGKRASKALMAKLKNAGIAYREEDLAAVLQAERDECKRQREVKAEAQAAKPVAPSSWALRQAVERYFDQFVLGLARQLALCEELREQEEKHETWAAITATLPAHWTKRAFKAALLEVGNNLSDKIGQDEWETVALPSGRWYAQNKGSYPKATPTFDTAAEALAATARADRQLQYKYQELQTILTDPRDDWRVHQGIDNANADFLREIRLGLEQRMAEPEPAPYLVGRMQRVQERIAEAQRLLELVMPAMVAPTVATCRVCGCTDDHACEGGCYWVEEDLCSRCVAKAAPSVLYLPNQPVPEPVFVQGESVGIILDLPLAQKLLALAAGFALVPQLTLLEQTALEQALTAGLTPVGA